MIHLVEVCVCICVCVCVCILVIMWTDLRKYQFVDTPRRTLDTPLPAKSCCQLAWWNCL